MFGILLKTYRRVETWKLDILETIENKKKKGFMQSFLVACLSFALTIQQNK